MHISKIELENIKSHAASTFEFSRGTTAITGENGAGKTTIIEAIAWVMFDVLDYKKEDFVRRGANKGSVRVTFESGLDEREYEVYRDSGAGYYVFDPRLQMRIADKKEEVFRFLWPHLGLEPGTDLRSLFKQAIGVPQGTFTAIFLEGGAERKAAFDRLLRVEEYRQAAEKLRETLRYVELTTNTVRESIARAEGELTRVDAVEKEHAECSARAQSLSAELNSLQTELSARQQLVNELDVNEKRIAELQNQFDRLKSEKEKCEIVLRQCEESLKRSADAVSIVANVRDDAERHQQLLGRIGEIERERNERDRLRAELAKVDAANVNIQAAKKRLVEDLETAIAAGREIELLRPRSTEQESLEREIAGCRDRVASARAAASQLATMDEKLERLREKYRENQSQITAADEKAQMAAELGALESRSGELVQSLASLQANLERDERFQSEIRNGLCPILSQKCLNLKAGETLEDFVSSQFSEIRTQITGLETERNKVSERLVIAREASKAAAALDALKKRELELTEEGKRLRAEKEELARQGARVADCETELADAEKKLAVLDDPRARIRFLEKQAFCEPEYREGLSKVESNLERLESERRLLAEQLDEYKDLDEEWSRLTATRDATAEPYRQFIANESEANSLADRQVQLETAKDNLAAGDRKLADLETLLTSASASYDSVKHQAERARLLHIERKNAEVRAIHEEASRREQQLEAELKRFRELRTSLAAEFREKERLEKLTEATEFIRATLKEAAPRVARNYVYHVSIEANQLFREIMANVETTLKWCEDYAIVLEEDGYERPFASFSGGEQMAAALAIRLALLKQLTDIRIAFFDEPTANMDAERRENLAMQISRITNFDQLFVISHDETFDSYVDNVITLGTHA